MNVQELLAGRLQNQQISRHAFSSPAELTTWMGGFQAQEYGQSKWAMGSRLPGSTITDIENAILNRSIIRTWAFRGTLHILPARDAWWIVGLVGPAVLKRMGSQFKKEGLDEALLNKTGNIIRKALEGNKQLTRADLFAILDKHGISTSGLRGAHILYWSALQRIICLGAPAGKQPTYTQFEEWAAPIYELDKNETLRELALRYFRSHGHATLQDFTWWSSLSAADAKAGLEMAKSSLKSVELEGQTYWTSKDALPKDKPKQNTFLLPGFDEYFLGYKDRSAFLDAAYFHEVATKNGIFHPVIVSEGRIEGKWKAIKSKNKLDIQLLPFQPLTDAELIDIEKSGKAFSQFLGLEYGGVI